MRCPRTLTVLRAASVASVLCLASIARTQPSADQVLTDMGFSAGDKQRVLNGEWVTTKVGAVSERDLTFAIAFLSKGSPDAISKQVIAGNLVTADAQVQGYGMLSVPGSLADFAALKITSEEADALSKAESGEKVNLSAGEIAAFKAGQDRSVQAIQVQLQRTLLVRYQEYRDSGLEGIGSYDRGGGRTTDVASDLRKATQAATHLRQYLPAFHESLLGRPAAAGADIQQQFLWVRSKIRGKPTYVLTHLLVASEGAARAVVRREYYASTGYNGEQAIAGLLPVAGGSVVVYTSHAFTDQVTGVGGSFKRSIGTRVMEEQMKEIFETARKRIER